jgi:hypothetical protein
MNKTAFDLLSPGYLKRMEKLKIRGYDPGIQLDRSIMILTYHQHAYFSHIVNGVAHAFTARTAVFHTAVWGVVGPP